MPQDDAIQTCIGALKTFAFKADLAVALKMKADVFVVMMSLRGY